MDSRQILDEFKQTWALMQTALEDGKHENSAQIDRLNARLDELEVKLQRPMLAGMTGPRLEPSAKPNRDLTAFFRAVAAGGAEKLRDATDRTDAERVMREAKRAYADVETKALAIGDDTLGGFLAPAEFVAEVIKGVQLISPVRQYAKVRPTARRSVQVPTRTGVFAAAWTGEVQTRTETLGLAYSLEELPTYEMYAEVLVSNQDLEDSAFDLAQEIADNAAEQFAKAEGIAFVKGTSVKQPEGFMVNSAITYDPMGTGGGSALTADGIISHVYALKSAYAVNATLMMNRKTLGAVRLLKDSQNRYIWEPNYQVGTPPTIMGIPYAEVPDMDDVGANTFPIAIGDFRRGYLIVDRIDMQVLKMVEKYAEQGQVAFLIRKRVGAQVVLPEAIRKLRVSVS